MSLDSFFEAKPEPKAEEAKADPVAVETTEPAIAEPRSDRARDEAGRFAKGETKVDEPKAEKPKEPEAKEAATPAAKEIKPEKSPEAGLAAGIAAERNKRQQAEQRAAELERRIASLESMNREPPPNPALDPQGFQRHLDTQVQTIQQQLQQQAMNDRLNMSEAIARQAHQDLDDVYAVFQEEAAQNPALAVQAMQQQHPWEWVYQQGKRLQLVREIGSDPESWRKAQRAELEAQIRAELNQQPAARESSPVPPPSLASARTTRVSEPVWTGPRPLNSMFKGR